MAFIKTYQHGGLAGVGTLAECQAFLAGLTPTLRAQYASCTFKVTDQGEQDLWIASDDKFYPVKDLVAPDYIQDIAASDSIALDVTDDVLTATLKMRSTGAIDATTDGVGLRTNNTESIALSISPDNKLEADVRIDTEQFNALSETADGLDVNLSNSLTSTAVANPIVSILDGKKSSTFEVTVLLNEASDNAIQVGSSAQSPTGLYAKKLAVATASQGLLSIDGNYQISIDLAKLNNIHVDEVSTSAATFVSNVMPTLTITKGDFIYIANAPKDERGYISKVDNPTSLADLVPVEYPDYTLDQIAAAFSAVNGIGYNPASKQFYGVADPNGRNDLTVSADGFKVDVYGAASSITGGIGNVSLTDNLTELYSRIATLNGVEYKNLITKTGNLVELGGTATKNTSMDLVDKVMTYTSTTGGVKFDTNNVAFLDKFYIKNELGEWLEMKVNGANFWSPSPVASIPF